jgi:hypothetical protein
MREPAPPHLFTARGAGNQPDRSDQTLKPSATYTAVRGLPSDHATLAGALFQTLPPLFTAPTGLAFPFVVDDSTA